MAPQLTLKLDLTGDHRDDLLTLCSNRAFDPPNAFRRDVGVLVMRSGDGERHVSIANHADNARIFRRGLLGDANEAVLPCIEPLAFRLGKRLYVLLRCGLTGAGAMRSWLATVFWNPPQGAVSRISRFLFIGPGGERVYFP